MVLASAALVPPTAPTFAATVPGSAERVIVTFEIGTTAADQARTIDAMGGELVRVVDERRVAVRVGGQRRMTLARDTRVAGIEPDVIYHVANTPNDPCYTNCFGISQWALDHLGAPSAWDTVPGTSAPVRVAVLDTGVRSTHPDFGGRVTRVSDFSSQSNTANDVNGHGTLVAGVIAATGNNGTGVAGVSWGAEIRSFKVLGDDGMGFASDAAAGVRAAADDGARVINMSFTGDPSSTLQSAVVYAQSKGALIVAAAGNNASTTPKFPAAYSGVMAVAATTPNDTLASFSNRGTWITLAAPGVDIASTTTGNSYLEVNGTSFSAPLVSGAAALLWLSTYGSNASSIRSRLIDTAVSIGAGAGAGLLQFGRSARRARSSPVPVRRRSPATCSTATAACTRRVARTVVSGYAYWAGWDIARATLPPARRRRLGARRLGRSACLRRRTGGDQLVRRGRGGTSPER